MASSVIPLHLNDGFRTSMTAPSSVTLRRMSAGMSEKYRTSRSGARSALR